MDVKTKGGLSTVQKMIIEKEDDGFHVSVSFQDEDGNELENISFGAFPTYEQAEGRYEYEMIMLNSTITLGMDPYFNWS